MFLLFLECKVGRKDKQHQIQVKLIFRFCLLPGCEVRLLDQLDEDPKNFAIPLSIIGLDRFIQWKSTGRHKEMILTIKRRKTIDWFAF